MLNHSDIAAILTVNECQNFSKAAQILHIGQPALSKKIREIERILGYEIFIRSRGQGSVKTSEHGWKLLPILEKIKQLNSQALDIKYIDRQLYVRLAASDGPFIAVLDTVIENVLREHERYIFKLKNLSYAECVDALSSEAIDIAFIGTNMYRRHINVTPLYEEDMVFVCKTGWTARDAIDPLSLNYAQGIYSPYSSEFSVWTQAMFRNQRPLVHCDLISQVKRYMQALDLWSIVPYSVARYIAKDADIMILPLAQAPPKRIIYCATRATTHNPAVDTFMDRVRATLLTEKHITLLL